MRIFKVDLYDYFKREKPSNYNGGILTCYVQDSPFPEEVLYPAMLVIPGGAYHHIGARESEPIALEFISYNYNAFVLSYSVETVKFPVALQECAMAMVYIRENYKDLKTKQDKIGCIGFSAGGHLVGTLSSLFDSEELNFLGDKKQLVKPNATIYGYPVVTYFGNTHTYSFDMLCGDNEELKGKLSLENLIHENCPPCFIVSTAGDNCVPCRNSLVLASAYEKANASYNVHIFAGGVHGLSLGTEELFINNEVDHNYYNQGMSSDYHKWFKMAITWLSDIGVK